MSIANQVRKRRHILGLTMQDVVDRVQSTGNNLSKTAISKYEHGTSVPRATTLRYLASALQCSPDFLISENTTEIEWLRFRKKTTLTKRIEAEVKETARQWLQAKILVNGSIPKEPQVIQLPSFHVTTIEEAESVAEEVRKGWGVGDWPLESLSVAIEKSGVFVVEVEAERDIDGLSGIANGGIRFVVVATGVPVDRMRMNLAHELGHIVMKPTDDVKFDERAAFRFGAALLLPKSIVFERIGSKRTTVSLQELLLLKEEYGLSLQALIRRCFDLGVISEWTYKGLNIDLRKRGWYRNEPGDCSQLERPSRFQSHLLRCLSEGLVSEREIETMFPEVARSIDKLDSDTDWEWAHLRSRTPEDRDEILQNAAQSAASEYMHGGSLADLELIDGEE